MLEFPELVVVGGHVGFPWLDEFVTLTVKFPNFYVDTSAYVLRRLPPAFVAVDERARQGARDVRHQLADAAAATLPRRPEQTRPVARGR